MVVGIHVQMSSFDFLFAQLRALFCGVSTGAKRFLLSIGGLLRGAATHDDALSEDTMVGAGNSAAARREGRRASTNVKCVKYTRKLQVTLVKK